MNGSNQPPQGMQLFDAEGRRLYFTEEERRAFVAAAAKAPREVRTFCGTLHAIGCRISEALALTARQIDLSGRVVVFESLKKRRKGVFRAVPVPASCWTPSTWCTASGKRSGAARRRRCFGRGAA
jgi:integrase